jgi:hypothetical protein
MRLHDIIAEMQRAEEATHAVPELRQRVDTLEAHLAKKQDTLNETLNSVDEANRKIAELEAKLKATEVERDAYFFRAEEAEEKLGKAATLLGVVPPAPKSGTESEVSAGQPVSVDIVKPVSEWGQSAEGPTSHSAHTSESHTDGIGSQASGTDGSASGPFVAATSQEASGTAGIAPTTHPLASFSDALRDDIQGPIYSGRKYYDKPHDVSWSEWEAHGGEKKPEWIG